MPIVIPKINFSSIFFHSKELIKNWFFYSSTKEPTAGNSPPAMWYESKPVKATKAVSKTEVKDIPKFIFPQ